MKIKQQIPNMLTGANLLFGAAGCYLAIYGRPDITAIFILIAAIFDFLDGFAARSLKAYSDIGKDLDSLADLISFGMAPGAIFSSMLHFHYTGKWAGEFFNLTINKQLLLLLPFILTVFAALRLAIFNNDKRQTENFLGLTTTATGMFTASLVYKIYTSQGWLINLTNKWVVIGLVFLFSFLLISEIPMFSLKTKDFKWKGNQNRYILLIVSILSIILLDFGALIVIIPFYILYSVILSLIKRQSSE